MSSLTEPKLRKLLGLHGGPQTTWSAQVREDLDGVLVQDMALGPRRIPALCLKPKTTLRDPVAILYCHAHGNAHGIGKSELLTGRPALLDPLGLSLARAGATVLCPDLPGFGARLSEGTESALSKSALWHGRSMIGQMVRDLCLALDVLKKVAQPKRVATVGISMGGTLSYMVAALRKDVTACAQLCVFADIAPLVATGQHDLHGPYMTIPGLLPDHDLSDIAAMVAPRPQLVVTGAKDPLTPSEAYLPAAHVLTEAYSEPEAALWLHRDADAGHHETPQSRHVLQRFLATYLGLEF